MANVVYLPTKKDVNAGGALGEGLSAAFLKKIQDEDKKQKADRALKMIDGIKNAGSRKAALEAAATVATQGAEDIQDVKFLYGLVDQFYPAGDTTPQKVELTGPDNKPVTRYVPKESLTKLNDPKSVEAMFGPGYKMRNKDNEYEFFSSSGDQLGRGTIDQRPAGALTKGELDFQQRERQNKREDARAAQFNATQERLARTEDRLAGQAEKADQERAIDNMRADLKAGEGFLVKGLGKQLPDGSFGFEDDNKQELFNSRVALYGDLLEQHYSNPKNKGKPVNWTKLAKKAVDAFPTKAESPTPKGEGAGTPPPSKKEPDETRMLNGKMYYRYGPSKWYDRKL